MSAMMSAMYMPARQHVEDAHGREAGALHLHAVGVHAGAVGHDVVAELAARGLGAAVDLALGRLHALGHLLVDVRLLHLLEPVQGLVHDLGALRHLDRAHPVAVEAGAERAELALADRHVELVVLVAAVGLVLAQVARRGRCRAGSGPVRS